MQPIMFTILLLAAGGAGAGLPCSIHLAKGLSDADLTGLAKITRAKAQEAALKAVHLSGASVASGELEAENGCLIYSFDIKVPGKRSIIEVAVDARDGKVLAQKRGGPKAQAAEAAADKAGAAPE